MRNCRHCGSKLEFIAKENIENSCFYTCNKCNTTWDYLDDNSNNGEVVIDVNAYLKDLSNRKVAS